MKKSHVVLAILLIASLIALKVVVDKNDQLKKDAASKEYWQQKKENDLKIAIILANKSWYIVDEFTVSSEKNGQGQIVNLPQRIIGKGNSYAIIRVVKDVKIIFVPNEKQIYQMTDYLTYQFENEKELLSGWR